MGVDKPIPSRGAYIASGIIGHLPVIPGEKFAVVPHVGFRNDGRTPAFPLQLSVGHTVAPYLENEPAYTKIVRLPLGHILAPDCETDISVDYMMEFSEEEVEAIGTQSAYLWLYCQLAYTDFVDDRHEPRFCWNWDCPDGVGSYYFTSDNNVPIDYRRKG